ncbi:PREDICTED: collagen EMF1-alpha-like [Tinamus guttatus]|uniref:collagen EMF1-alpha-like n=1 Tax=Tinamus guttatus TaxID=94827 RepID=UPI00052F2159|nr:PREDICTED: collagen EMF1-alpha-like [Tinamus guttatus]
MIIYEGTGAPWGHGDTLGTPIPLQGWIGDTLVGSMIISDSRGDPGVPGNPGGSVGLPGDLEGSHKDPGDPGGILGVQRVPSGILEVRRVPGGIQVFPGILGA